MALAAGVRCSLPGKDAGSVRIDDIRARLRTPPGGEQRGPAAQPVFRRTLLVPRSRDARCTPIHWHMFVLPAVGSLALLAAAVIAAELLHRRDDDLGADEAVPDRFSVTAPIVAAGALVLGPWPALLVGAAGSLSVRRLAGDPWRESVVRALSLGLAGFAGGYAYILSGSVHGLGRAPRRPARARDPRNGLFNREDAREPRCRPGDGDRDGPPRRWSRGLARRGPRDRGRVEPLVRGAPRPRADPGRAAPLAPDRPPPGGRSGTRDLREHRRRARQFDAWPLPARRGERARAGRGARASARRRTPPLVGGPAS